MKTTYRMTRGGGRGVPLIIAELSDGWTWRVWAEPETVPAKAAASSMQRVLNLWTEAEVSGLGPADGEPAVVIYFRAAEQFRFEPVTKIKRGKEKPEPNVVY